MPRQVVVRRRDPEQTCWHQLFSSGQALSSGKVWPFIPQDQSANLCPTAAQGTAVSKPTRSPL